MNPIDRLVAIEDIRQLKARYWRSVDARNWDDWRAAFVPDVRFEFPELDRTVGIEEFLEWSIAFLQGSRSVHRGYLPEIEITGETTAKGLWAFEDRLWWNDSNPGPNGLVRMEGDGHSRDDYEKHDGVWKIRSLTVTRQRLVSVSSQIALSVDDR